jgi:hypothetical protein
LRACNGDTDTDRGGGSARDGAPRDAAAVNDAFRLADRSSTSAGGRQGKTTCKTARSTTRAASVG